MTKTRITATEENEYFIYGVQNDRIYLKEPDGETAKISAFELMYYVQAFNLGAVKKSDLLTYTGLKYIWLDNVYYIPKGRTSAENFWEVLRTTLDSNGVSHEHYIVLNSDTGKYLNYTGKASAVSEGTALNLWEIIRVIITNPYFGLEHLMLNDLSGEWNTFKERFNKLLEVAALQ